MLNSRRGARPGASRAAVSNAYQTNHEPADLEYNQSVASSADDRQFATTLARGFEILRCFSAVRPVLGNKELADETGLSRPTISRFTYTLVRLGYLRSVATTGKYRLGPAVISLGYPLLATLALRQTARPLMNELARKTGSSVSMGIRDRLSIVYVETSRASAPWSAQLSDIGLRYPIASTAIGHAYVAGLDQASREALLNEIRVHTPATWSRYGERLRAVREELTRKGFCSSYGEQHPDYHAVGVPFGIADDGEAVVFNCVAQIDVASREDLEKTLGPQLMSMVVQLRSAAVR
ncbi:MAG: IclR family transcriptional regulator [Variovorax paradoxus]|uniref:IclR family transcriptional regulator n=1 Tax=Variovorax paradoxus TaxID=34073 RepID=A0A2W5QP32_VARPD|nr:MAG: IclR family transcriptional regulator [Variovorax paradoxus]